MTSPQYKPNHHRRWLIAGIVAVVVIVTGYFWASETLIEVSAEEGTWKLVQSRYYVGEQGSVFLTGDMDRVLQSYPMPGGPPTWIVLDDDYVYVGRVGDGGLPDSGLVRIERDTLKATSVVIPVPNNYHGVDWSEEWLVATPEEAAAYAQIVRTGRDAEGTSATSWIGPVAVDLDRINEFIAQVSN